jgi:hypothetical protein
VWYKNEGSGDGDGYGEGWSDRSELINIATVDEMMVDGSHPPLLEIRRRLGRNQISGQDVIIR